MYNKYEIYIYKSGRQQEVSNPEQLAQAPYLVSSLFLAHYE